MFYHLPMNDSKKPQSKHHLSHDLETVKFRQSQSERRDSPVLFAACDVCEPKPAVTVKLSKRPGIVLDMSVVGEKNDNATSSKRHFMGFSTAFKIY